MTGQKGIHDLSDDDQGRIAGIIVDVFESHIHRLFVVIWKYFHMIAAGVEGSLQNAEMERGHLRAQNGVVPAHFPGKCNLFDGRGPYGTLAVLCLLGADSCQKRADTNTGGPQIVHLVDFQAGVDFAASFQNLVYLIRCNGIQTAAEGIELNQIQIIPCFTKLAAAYRREWYIHWSLTRIGRSMGAKWETESSVNTAMP